MIVRLAFLLGIAALLATSRIAASAAPAADPCGDPRLVSQGYTMFPAIVLEVESGDRLRVRVDAAQHTPAENVGTYAVRLVATEAPAPGSPAAEKARNRLAERVLGKEIQLLVSPFQEDGTPVNVIVQGVSPEFTDENLGQIAAGMARAVDQGAYDVDWYLRCQYRRAEEAAKSERLGMWGARP
jgi:endonuclease YncB( thermonuclease family)